MSRIESFGALRQREPRVRDKAHMGKVARLPCIACLARRGAMVRPVHVAHVRCGFLGEPGWRAVGAGERPSDVRTAPLCPRCHLIEQHGQNERRFWAGLGIYPPSFCAGLVIDFAHGEDGLRTLRDAAQGRFPWPPEQAP